MKDHLVRTLSKSGGLRILGCSVTELSKEICELQKTSKTSSVATSRALASAALMGGTLKDEQRVAIKFEGNGPIGKIIVEADAKGAIAANVGNPSAELEPINNRYNVAGIIGNAGLLTVSRDLGIGKEPYVGTVILQTSEIGEDLAYYLTTSEQIPSAVGVGASLDDTNVVTAGGFLVQVLPKASEEEIEKVMGNISNLPAINELLSSHSLDSMFEKLWSGVDFIRLEEKELFFKCSCSQAKVEKALISLGKDELEKMVKESQTTEIKCEFCKVDFHINQDDIKRIIKEIEG